MKTLFLLLLSTALLSAEVAVAARTTKAPGKRSFIHTNDIRGRSNHMRFRRNPHPLPALDLKAHNPEKFKTVRGAKNYKYK